MIRQKCNIFYNLVSKKLLILQLNNEISLVLLMVMFQTSRSYPSHSETLNRYIYFI